MNQATPIGVKNSPAWQMITVIVVVFSISLIIIHFLNARTQTAQTKYFEPGVALYIKGDYTDAENDFNSALQLMPQETSSSYFLAMCMLQEGRVSEARHELRQTKLDAESTGTARGPDDRYGPRSQQMLDWMDKNPDWQPRLADGTANPVQPPDARYDP